MPDAQRFPYVEIDPSLGSSRFEWLYECMAKLLGVSYIYGEVVVEAAEFTPPR